MGDTDSNGNPAEDEVWICEECRGEFDGSTSCCRCQWPVCGCCLNDDGVCPTCADGAEPGGEA